MSYLITYSSLVNYKYSQLVKIAELVLVSTNANMSASDIEWCTCEIFNATLGVSMC